MSDDFYQDPTANLSQGDILVLPHLHIDTKGELGVEGFVEITASGRTAPSIVLNFDCEIDKPWSKRFVVCPIVPLDSLKQHERTNAKKNRIAHLFFMPRYKAILPDSVAVLNQLTTIDRSLVDPSTRLLTLSKTGRLAMYTQFVRWLSRWELATLTCPRCGSDFDPTIALPVRHPDEP